MTHIVRKFCAYDLRQPGSRRLTLWRSVLIPSLRCAGARRREPGWICVTCAWFTPDARHIRESDANVARTCRARSAQQGMLLFDPSLAFFKDKVTRRGLNHGLTGTFLPSAEQIQEHKKIMVTVQILPWSWNDHSENMGKNDFVLLFILCTKPTAISASMSKNKSWRIPGYKSKSWFRSSSKEFHWQNYKRHRRQFLYEIFVQWEKFLRDRFQSLSAGGVPSLTSFPKQGLRTSQCLPYPRLNPILFINRLQSKTYIFYELHTDVDTILFSHIIQLLKTFSLHASNALALAVRTLFSWLNFWRGS
jgi:hypothetical protein